MRFMNAEGIYTIKPKKILTSQTLLCESESKRNMLFDNPDQICRIRERTQYQQLGSTHPF
jgi:hypothetical protein